MVDVGSPVLLPTEAVVTKAKLGREGNIPSVQYTNIYNLPSGSKETATRGSTSFV